MRTLLILVIAAVTLVSLAGPSLAQTTMAGPPTHGKTAVPAKAKTSTATKSHRLVGDVVAVDQTGKTVTIKYMVQGQPREATFTAAQQAVPKLAALKPGDRVRVGYNKEQGQLIAHSVVATHHQARHSTTAR